MSTLIRRRVEHSSPLATPSNNSKSFYLTNKSKSLNWWRVLVGSGSASNRPSQSAPVAQKVCDQVRLDVERAFCFDSGLPKFDINEQRDRLYRVIISVLERNPSFIYYQGFHEICSMFLVVFPDENNEEKCISAVESFSKDYLSMFLHESFDKTLKQFTEETFKLASNYNFELGKLRATTAVEKDHFIDLIREIREIVEPHGLIASWFLTWFVHEFPDFDDSLAIFDFQLTEISTRFAPIYLASSLLILHKNSMLEWTEEPFELIMFLRNLPKIASPEEVIGCSLLLFKSASLEKNKRRNVLKLQVGMRFWSIIIALHFIYYILSITLLPKLKQY